MLATVHHQSGKVIAFFYHDAIHSNSLWLLKTLFQCLIVSLCIITNTVISTVELSCFIAETILVHLFFQKSMSVCGRSTAMSSIDTSREQGE